MYNLKVSTISVKPNNSKLEKIENTLKIQVKLPHENKKPLAREQNFVQTSFSD